MCNSCLPDLDINIAIRGDEGGGANSIKIARQYGEDLGGVVLAPKFIVIIIVIRWKSACKVSLGLLASTSRGGSKRATHTYKPIFLHLLPLFSSVA